MSSFVLFSILRNLFYLIKLETPLKVQVLCVWHCIADKKVQEKYKDSSYWHKKGTPAKMTGVPKNPVVKPILIYRSNEPANRRTLYRDVLRREPFHERCRKGIAKNTGFMRVFSVFEYPL